jgi:hypothetical protein
MIHRLTKIVVKKDKYSLQITQSYFRGIKYNEKKKYDGSNYS